MNPEPQEFDDDGYEPTPPADVHPPKPKIVRPKDPFDADLGLERLTELGNAKRLVRLYGKNLRYTGAMGWLGWDGRRWKPDETEAAMRCAKRSVLSMLTDVASMGATSEAESLAKWAIRSQKQSIIEATLKLARSEDGVAVRRADFDLDPNALNGESGTTDLTTGKTRPHRQSDNITKLAPCAYDPTAHSPLWESFLEKFLPDPSIRAFFKRYIGSALTGDATDQSLVIMYGPGGNGKSTAIETIQKILGDYSVVTPFSTLTAPRDKNAASNDLARLAGARFVVAAEPPEGVSLNTATVKALTGGDTISARMLYKEYFEFKPEFKLCLVTNHRPQISEATHAIWRRVHLVPWTVKVGAERIENFADLLWKERAGILRWAIDGCMEWQTEGLSPPPSVVAATDEYRREEDSFGAFLEDRCVLGMTGVFSPSAPILSAYNKWAKDNGFPSVSVKTLAGKLREKGIESKRMPKGMTWAGIGVRPDESDEP